MGSPSSSGSVDLAGLMARAGLDAAGLSAAGRMVFCLPFRVDFCPADVRGAFLFYCHKP